MRLAQGFRFGLLALLFPLLLPISLPAVASDTAAAAALAHRFSEEAQRAAREAERRKREVARRQSEARRKAAEARRAAEEADMLARARHEAEQRRNLTRREVEQKAEEARRQAEAVRQAAEQKAEVERLARIEQERVATEAKAVADREANLAETRRQVEAAALERRRQEADAVQRSDTRREAMTRERAEEMQRVDAALDALRRRQQGRFLPSADLAHGPTRPETGGIDPDRTPAWREPPSHPAWPPVAEREDDPSFDRAQGGGHGARFAVLLLMEPGHRGIRRNNPTADPVLCVAGGCYVSAGGAEPATLMRRRRALGFFRTWGERAGACRNQTACIFRDIELGSFPAYLQPIDMRLVRHDRRQAMLIDDVAGCRLERGDLTCRETVRGPDYRLWIVPEDVAKRAGVGLLERALESGLPSPEQVSDARPDRNPLFLK